MNIRGVMEGRGLYQTLVKSRKILVSLRVSNCSLDNDVWVMEHGT